MRKGSVIVGAGLLALLLSSSATFAAPAQHLDWGFQLNASDTACPPGDSVLNISYKLTNSLDSGTGTNDYGTPWWAYLDYVLQVQVFQLDDTTFCARVKNEGSWESVGGDGPGCLNDSNCGTVDGRLEAGVVGTMQGGFTMTFPSSDFNPDDLKTKGSIGRFDHDCDAAAGTCDGAGVTRWRSLYFPDYSSSSFAWWGWVYHGGRNGSWANAANGNTGNLTGD